MGDFSFRNNPKLKQVGVEIEWTEERIQEFRKCAKDPIYFIENYFHIVHIDHGLVKMKLWEYQKEFIDMIHNNRFVSARMARQMGKTTVVAAYLCWFIIFNPEKYVGIVANKAKGAKSILKRIKKGYQDIPKWLQQGVVEWNKESIELENGSVVQAAATSSDSIRGDSLSFLYVDECAFINPKIWDEFWKSTYAVISSGNKSKCIITSTPDGMNHFYHIHTAAMRSVEEGGSFFEAIDVPWHKHPDRDEQWKETTIANTDPISFSQEHDIQFIGSSKTLVSPMVLQGLLSSEPVFETPSVKIFKEPERNHTYLTTVDVGRGLSKDYSVFKIIDITNPLKHEEVATYRNNEISHMALPEIIVDYSMKYNESHVLVELNDLGETVAELIYNTHDYHNIAMIKPKHSRRRRLGVQVTKTTKSKGCQNLKLMIESASLKINDPNTIAELHTFIEVGSTFMADSGFHDDCVMTLVNYAWYTDSRQFRALNEYSLVDTLDEHSKQETAAEIGYTPSGFSSNSEPTEHEGVDPSYML